MGAKAAVGAGAGMGAVEDDACRAAELWWVTRADRPFRIVAGVERALAIATPAQPSWTPKASSNVAAGPG